MSRVVVIGGGAAGMMAAIGAAGAGHQVHIYEKNEKLGKKIFITGKGRCNLTNACDTEELFGNIIHNPKFLYSSFYSFTNFDMMDLMEQCGCPVKTERGNRVFPVSDKSSDVIHALSVRLRELGVEVHLHEEAAGLETDAGHVTGIRLKKGGRLVPADAVIVATGGLSYPTTGSTGDGYRFAKAQGHTVTELSPALVPFETRETVVKDLQGLSLRNIRVRILKGSKELYEEFGEMLFTHYGVSGPVLLSASSFVAEALKKEPLTLTIDLKPALSEEQLDARILRDFEEIKNKQYKNALVHLLPAKLMPVIVERSQISPEKQVNEITREERHRIVSQMKDFRLTLTGLRDYKEAIITQGGVSVREVNPSTMESKKIQGLYFAGEVLDLDGVTGGFNLQIAWSTGYLAGSSIE
ncbi:MAG: NAD(P)/FAD-dependent oxidoreductase [Lachnospiraceae bacterium]|nr:NAD(P)/FAD-dependent oxidoreductase [Lachnospiraceae bacterium]